MLTDLHPTEGVLHDFLLGKLPDAEHEDLESHLSGCDACQGRAAGLQTSDTLVGLLTATYCQRQAAVTPSAPGPSTATFAWPPSDSPAACAADLPDALAGHPRYRPVRLIGSGGMGSVWLAEHALMGRAVAVKVIRPDRHGRPQAVERFVREIQAVARLDGAHIVRAYDAERIGDACLLVMEYVAGVTLSEALQAGPLPAAEACRAARDAAKGLAVAHAAGLIHRDIKPSNLIRTADGVTKVLDFGLATAGPCKSDDAGPADDAPQSPALTADQMVIGTPDYIAPEQVTDAAAADARADVYALGCTLYHLLAGRVPFPADSVLRKIESHGNVTELPAPLTGVPAGLAAVVARMMAKNPADRVQTAAEVASLLEPFCEAGRAGGVPPPIARTPRRFAVGAIAAVLALIAAGVVYRIHRDGNEVITVATDDPAIEVTMKRNGDLIRIADTKAGKTWELDAKAMRLRPDGGALSIDLPDGGPLILRRNGDATVSIKREANARPGTDADGPNVPAVEELHRIPFAYGGWHNFVADGKEFLAYTPRDGKRVAVIFDTATGKETGRFPVPEGIYVGVWFIPGSQDLLVSVDHHFGRWDRRTGTKILDLGVFAVGPFGGTRLMPLSADGGTICAAAWGAFGPDRHGVFVYDIKSGNERFRVKQLHGQSILAITPHLAPNGKLLATTDTTPAASTIRLWDATGGELVKAIDVAGALTGDIEFSRGGRELIARYTSGPGLGFLGMWDVATGRQVGKVSVPHCETTDLSNLYPQAELFVVRPASRRSVRFYDSRTGERLGIYRSDEVIHTAAASADGRYALYATETSLRVCKLPGAPVGTKK